VACDQLPVWLPINRSECRRRGHARRKRLSLQGKHSRQQQAARQMSAPMTSIEATAPAPVSLSVVMPAYQEEENLRLLLPRILDSLRSLGVSFEVVVVDTMAPLDATREVCEQLQVRFVARRGGNSFGDAFRTGIAEARGEFVIFMDSDGSHSPEWIPKLFAYHSSHDVVIASRYVREGFTENSWVLVSMSRTLNWTYSLVLGIDCRDVSNSYRLYRGAQLKALTLTCDNFDIVEEVLFKLVRQNRGLRIHEVPFTFKQRMFGKTKRNLVLFIVTYLYTLIKLRFSA
jgi:dolichol-phosphate mannosyltransferase